jgi:predicted DNA-binding protein (UPF0251 family)
MTDLDKIKDALAADTRCSQVPLTESLRAVPANARYVEETPTSAHYYPVGRYCHEAADAISALVAEYEQLRAEVAYAKSHGVGAELSIAHKEVVRLRAELEAARRDSERYLWLRNRAIWLDPPNSNGDMVWCVVGKSAYDCEPCEGAELDAAIDEARK